MGKANESHDTASHHPSPTRAARRPTMLNTPTAMGAAKICPSVRWFFTARPSRGHQWRIDPRALRDGAFDADTGLAPAQPKINARPQNDDRQHVEQRP